MTARALFAFVALVSFAGCKPEPAPSATSSNVAPTGTSAAQGSAQSPASSAPAKAVASAGAAKGGQPAEDPQSRAYLTHLRKGRALSGQKRYAEARAELGLALEARPGDPEAQLEMGWACFLAGDMAAARKATEAGLASARSDALRAKAEYNLGRVAEAEGDKPAAGKRYRASLALRKNEVVSRRLRDLEAPVTSPPAREALPCLEPRKLDEVCGCMASALSDPEQVPPGEACKVVPVGNASLESSLRIAEVHAALGEKTLYLLALGPKGWATVASLGGEYNPGMAGVSEDWKVSKLETREAGGRKVLWLETTHGRTDSDMGIDEIESSEEVSLTLCPLADASHPQTTCPVQLPLSTRYERSRMNLVKDSDIDPDTRKLMTPGLPQKRASSYEVSLDAEGFAQLRLTRGKPDEGATKPGKYKLW